MENNNRTLAMVGTTAITENDVTETIVRLGARAEGYNNPQGRAMILEQLIEQALFLTDAKKNMLEYDATFKKQLTRMKEDLLTQFAISKSLERVKVTVEEIEKFYSENPDQFAPREIVGASHILVDSEEKCREIMQKITDGEIAFEDAAKQFSSCPSSQNGGNLGEFGRGQMVPEFDAVCFEMDLGELRGPVKTQFGYHIIRLDSKKTSDPVKLSEARSAIEEHLLNEKRRTAYTSKINQMKILYPVQRF